jgi:hypothetical protein
MMTNHIKFIYFILFGLIFVESVYSQTEEPVITSEFPPDVVGEVLNISTTPMMTTYNSNDTELNDLTQGTWKPELTTENIDSTPEFYLGDDENTTSSTTSSTSTYNENTSSTTTSSTSSVKLPDPSRNLTVSNITSREAHLSWNQKDDDDIEGYLMTVGQLISFDKYDTILNQTLNNNTRNYHLTNLSGQYFYRVSLWTLPFDNNSLSEIEFLTPSQIPCVPVLNVSISNNSLILNWTNDDCLWVGIITEYEIIVNELKFKIFGGDRKMIISLDSLKNKNNLNIQIRAKTSSGFGDWTNSTLQTSSGSSDSMSNREKAITVVFSVLGGLILIACLIIIIPYVNRLCKKNNKPANYNQVLDLNYSSIDNFKNRNVNNTQLLLSGTTNDDYAV